MKMQGYGRMLGLGAILALIAGGAWYAAAGNDAAEERYKLQGLERGNLTQSVSANGTLNPVSVVNVGTQVSGTVKKLLVDFNSRVEPGQVLVELDDTLLGSQVGQDEANVRNAAAALDLAAANERRAQSLIAQEYISRQELDTSVQARKSAQAQLEQAQAGLRKSRANLSYTVIRSPVSGVVVDRQIDVGQTVAASFQTPTLFKIARDLSKMQIDSAFAEADIGLIREGQAVRFNVDAFPNRPFQGAVKQIRLNPTTQSNVVTYDVVIAVDNADQALLPGMTAYVNIGVAKREDALLVPNAALRFKPVDAPKPAAKPEKAAEKGPPGDGQKKRRDGSSGTVWTLAGRELKAVSVTLGITDGRTTEILGGELKAGDKVVVGENGSGKGKPGAPPGTQFRLF